MRSADGGGGGGGGSHGQGTDVTAGGDWDRDVEALLAEFDHDDPEA